MSERETQESLGAFPFRSDSLPAPRSFSEFLSTCHGVLRNGAKVANSLSGLLKSRK
jgi:hypothetical protein